jgi:PAS domain S-box-containing protein
MPSVSAAIIAGSPDAVLVVDEDGRFQEANPAACRLLGYARDELLQLRRDDVISSGAPWLGEALATSSSDGTWRGEIELIRRDGTCVPLEATSVAIAGPDGPLYASFLREVTEHRQAKSALQVSEAKLAQAQEIAQLGSWEWDIASNTVTWSDQLYRIFGLAPQIAGTYQELLARVHPDDRELVNTTIERSLATAEPFTFQHRIVMPGGGVRVLDGRGEVMLGDDGHPLRMQGIVQDITDRKRAEEQLRVSETRYRSLVEQLPAVVYILAADPNQTPMYFSSYIEEVTGETAEEALAFRGHWLQLVHPEDRARIAAEDARTSPLGEIFRAEYRHARKDGSYVWVRDECVPLWDEAGQIIAWQGVMLDITDRLRLEVAEAETRAKAEQRDQLGIILDHLPSGVLILSGPDAQVEQANATAVQMIFGAAAAPGMLPVSGRDFRLLWTDTTPRDHSGRLGIRALHGEDAGHQQLLLACQDGRQVPVLAHAAPLPPTDDGISRAVLVLQDATRLREAEQLKDDFLALVSHEFRTPLTAIHGGAHLLLEQTDALDPVTRHELLTDIVAESDRLDRMLSNMLTVTGVIAGRLAVQTEPVLLGPLVRQTAAEVAARTQHVSFRTDLPDSLPAAEGDPALLAEVLTNLYENAAKYSPAGGEIVTSALCTEQRLTLAVTDQGMGIAPDEVAHVFTRFHRASADPTVRGMGLGLYLSRYLIEAQGGTIVARSPGPGQGSTFAITLPIARGWMEGEPDVLPAGKSVEYSECAST